MFGLFVCLFVGLRKILVALGFLRGVCWFVAVLFFSSRMVQLCRRIGCSHISDDFSFLCRPKEIEALSDKQIVKIATGTACSFGVSSDGSAYAWGFGENMQLSTGEEDALVPTLMTGKTLENRRVVSIAAGGQHTVMHVVNK
eukprot:m.529742 g.529742  ORF g.529742 m.529742 type:complete len:142 (+) comp57565_c0_seq2:111-536(+)